MKNWITLKSVTCGAMLAVAISAFVVLGWLPGSAAFFSGIGAPLDEYSPSGKSLQSDGNAKESNPVAAILSHWEYTSHCTSAAVPNCPANCGSGVCGGTATGPSSCCTGNNAGTCMAACLGCCIAPQTSTSY